MEIWKDIKGYEGLYQVSNYGRVKSLPHKIYTKDGKVRNWRGGFKKNVFDGNYYGIILCINGIKISRRIHRLVGETFIPNPNCLPDLNHIDCDKTNNHVDNLEWCTKKENIQHAIKNGLINQNGVNSCRSIFNQKEINEIRKKYIPYKYTTKKLAEEYGVCMQTIQRIINRERYDT